MTTFYDLFQAFITVYGTAMGFGPAVQAYRIWKRRSSGDVSMFMLCLVGLGCLFWFIWGLISTNWPLIVANAFAILTYGLAIAMALWYRESRHAMTLDALVRVGEEQLIGDVCYAASLWDARPHRLFAAVRLLVERFATGDERRDAVRLMDVAYATWGGPAEDEHDAAYDASAQGPTMVSGEFGE